VDFEEAVKPLRDHYRQNCRAFNRIKDTFIDAAVNRDDQALMMKACTLERLVELAIDRTTMSLESIADELARRMGRELPGKQYSDIASFMEQYFFTEDN
jgi:hypothetical protein